MSSANLSSIHHRRRVGEQAYLPASPRHRRDTLRDNCAEVPEAVPVFPGI